MAELTGLIPATEMLQKYKEVQLITAAYNAVTPDVTISSQMWMCKRKNILEETSCLQDYFI